MKKVDWNELINFDYASQTDVVNFANGTISGREFYDRFKGTEVAGVVRSLIRDRKVNDARSIARKALKRRGLVA